VAAIAAVCWCSSPGVRRPDGALAVAVRGGAQLRRERAAVDPVRHQHRGHAVTEKLPWISTFNVYYALGVDGIAMPLILLTTSSPCWW